MGYRSGLVWRKYHNFHLAEGLSTHNTLFVIARSWVERVVDPLWMPCQWEFMVGECCHFLVVFSTFSIDVCAKIVVEHMFTFPCRFSNMCDRENIKRWIDILHYIIILGGSIWLMAPNSKHSHIVFLELSSNPWYSRVLPMNNVIEGAYIVCQRKLCRDWIGLVTRGN